MEKKNNSGLAGLASFLALLLATALFITEYIVDMAGTSWGQYLAIARDISIAIGILFGSLNYIRGRNFFIKLLFFAAIAAYIAFAFIVPLTH